MAIEIASKFKTINRIAHLLLLASVLVPLFTVYMSSTVSMDTTGTQVILNTSIPRDLDRLILQGKLM